MTMLRKNEELLALIRESTIRRTKTRNATLLRPFMDEIEAALANGATREGIRDSLATGGLDMPLSTFNSILYRYRNKHRMKKAPPASSTPKQITPVSPSSGKAASSGTAAPATAPKTGMNRLNKIMRSTPDLAELTRLAKETRKDKT